MKSARQITLTDEERKALECWSRGRRTPARLVLRAKIVLRASQGMMNKEIAKKLKTAPKTVSLWRTRFADHRLAGIEKDAPRGGTTATSPRANRPGDYRENYPRNPGRCDPLEHADTGQSSGYFASDGSASLEGQRTSTASDENVQAQQRPAFYGEVARRGGAVPRSAGTTTLFAAIEMAGGKLIGTCMKRHRHQEWIKFLKLIDAETPAELDLHLIVDNYATHKHPKVQAWLKRHSRFHVHFTPTSSSWLNMIERWFREITVKRLRRGTFRNVAQLIDAIESFIKDHNGNPQAFTWTAQVDEILAKIERARKVLHKTPTA